MHVIFIDAASKKCGGNDFIPRHYAFIPLLFREAKLSPPTFPARANSSPIRVYSVGVLADAGKGEVRFAAVHRDKLFFIGASIKKKQFISMNKVNACYFYRCASGECRGTKFGLAE